jgi:hypothetical protein
VSDSPTSELVRRVLIVIVAMLVIALLAYARGDAGDDGRFPDRDDIASTIVIGA